jgi:GT2 family glycosyltransferase
MTTPGSLSVASSGHPPATPMVTICVPTYNSQSTLAATLESVLAQDYSNFHILVVDNCSLDRTLEIADGFAAKDARVRVMRHEANAGAEGNFNRCLQYATGKYVGVFHADDVFHSDMISTQVRVLEANPQVGVVLTHALLIDGEACVIGERFVPPELAGREVSVLTYGEVLKLCLRYGNFLTCPSALMRVELVQSAAVGGWSGSEFGTSADLDLWLRFARHGALAYLRRALMSYRVSEASYSAGVIKVRTTRHPLFKVLEFHRAQGVRDGVIDSRTEIETQRDLEFLLLKDDALIALNRMRRGESVPSSLSLGARAVRTLPALCRSKFHFKFGVSVFGIALVARVYEWGAKPLIRYLLTR